MCVKLISFTKDYLDVLGVAVGMPYSNGNKASIKTIQKVIDSGHLSVLEHCNCVVEVERSVAVLGQLTRHRHLQFTVKSARGSKFDMDSFVLPADAPQSVVVALKKAIYNYLDILEETNNNYDVARYVLPQGIKTKLVLSGNFRAFYEYLPKRLCHRAMREHRELAEQIHTQLLINIPEVFNRHFIGCADCKELGGCTFGSR